MKKTTNIYFIDIGQKVRARRCELGLTANELSRISGVSESAICRLESGTVESRPGTIKRIYGALGIKPDATASGTVRQPAKPPMTEKQLEKEFKDAVVNAGGMAYKFVSPGHNGVPDRLVIIPMPGATSANIFPKFGFVEIKKPGGGKISAVQKAELKRLTGYGAKCYVLDDPDKINSIIYDIETESFPDVRYKIEVKK